MNLKLRLAVVLTAGLFFAACSRKNEVSVTSTNFADADIDQQQNLTFAFNKDIYPDSLLQQWDSNAYIQFQPAVRGSFKWTSSSELQFSPAEGFQPGTDYTATLTPQLLHYTKKPYKLDSKTLHFHTAGLHVLAANLSYAKGVGGGNVQVQLDLNFNYAVKAADAAAKLKLSSSGRDIIARAINGGATGKTVSLQFDPIGSEHDKAPLKIDIAKGIKMATGNFETHNDTTIKTEVPARSVLEITGISSQHTGTQAIVTITTSQPVYTEGLQSLITIEPAVAFTATATDGGFTITSDAMTPENTYELTVNQQLLGELGGHMKEDYSEQITFGKLEPAIHFVNSKGIYLSPKGYKNLALNIVSVPKVEVTVVKVYENNLEHFFRRGNTSDYGYDDEGGDNGGSYEHYETENMGDTISHQTYETAKLPALNAARVLHLNFEDKIRGYDGVYIITVASSDHRWVQESKILSLSDIGMIVKQEKDNIYVFANSIHDAKPLSGVKVSFISTNNQRLETVETDGDGMATLEKMGDKHPGFRIGMVTAKDGDDFSFIWLDQSAVETSRYDVGGRTPNATGLNAMIYAERNLYRPGEVAHVSTIVRDESWGNPGELPIKLKLIMPNGKEFATMRKILNEQGSCETIFPIPPTALTGTYTLEVYSSNDVLLNSYNISIEDFVPDRLKAEIRIPKKEYSIGDSIVVGIQADNLFGTPAMNRNYDCELNIEKQSFSSDKYNDYDFSTAKDFSFNTVTRTGSTDEHGSASAGFGLHESDLADVGLLKGNITTTVFDETGRPVHRFEHFNIYTQPAFLGIKSVNSYVSTHTPVRLPLIALDKNGNPQSTIAHVVVLKNEWHTVIEQTGDHYRYVSKQETKTISESNVTIAAGGSAYSFIPVLSGDYEVRISLPGSTNYVSKTIYAWGSGDSQYTSFEVNNEGNIDIKPDKEKYNVGDRVKLLFTTPFEGRMLVTIERDKMLKHYYLNTENKSASLDLKAEDLDVPNAYVTATLFRPMSGENIPLTVAHGFRNITVENVRNHIPVTVTMVQKTRSKTKQTITVKTEPGAYVTIAAVDEGILQVKNYETPDAYKYFYQKVALAMSSYDIYPLLLPEIKTTLSSTGGDAAEKSELRVNPTFVNRFKLVSFWSGIMEADGSGIVRYNIDVPQFSGDIRVMAVAYKGKGFGGADQHMKVADPVVISTALPRVLSPKDQVTMPVTVSNTTAKDAVANITVQAAGPVSILGGMAQRVTIPANREARVVFHIAAQPAIGAGKITVAVQAMNETFTDVTDIGVRPPASLQKLTGSGVAPAGVVTTISTQNNFIPSTASGKLIIGKSPLVQFSKNMQYLVQYPYGCVEQTTSAAFPQLYYADLVKSITGSAVSDPNPAYNVQQAISKLQSMQLSNGGLSYWPEVNGEESWWGSVHATHFLLEAKKAGYEVNDNTLNHLLQYLKFKLQKRETEILYYNQNLKKEIAAKEVAYSLYVLALAGESQPATMNYYKGNPGMLSIDSKYLLAAAYALSGQPQQARQVLPPSFSGEAANQAFGGSFYSYTRDLGISLNALIDIDPANQQVPILSRLLSQQLRAQPYLNTQENVFAILALGKMARSSNTGNATATITSGGKSLGNTPGASLSIDLKPYLNRPIQVAVKGTGNYYYFWETAGITADGSYKQEDSYMRVRRFYYDRNGRPITTNSFHQNDLIVVRLSLDAQYQGTIDNVVVTDMLPAGFEIENTRLNDLPELKWIKSQTTPDYMDYRDDRINLFTSASSTRRDFYYMVRAVSPGIYQLGPVQADAMYNGFYHSYNGAGVVTVSER